MVRARILVCVPVFGLFVTLALAHCGDDTTAVVEDAGTQGPDVGALPDVTFRDANPPALTTTVNVIALELKNQPKAGVADKTFPALTVQAQPAIPTRAPDAFAQGALPGLGCQGFKFSPGLPADPKGPHFIDEDVGDITIDGFTGSPDIPKPLLCTRQELLFPGSGIFQYKCNQKPLSFALNFPVENFLEPGDQVVASSKGGPALGPIAAAPLTTVAQVPNDNFVVTTDLWGLTPAQLDGSADLKLAYTCNGGPCQKGMLLIAQIQTTDRVSAPANPDAGADAGAAASLAPYDFLPPSSEFGLILCRDLLTQNQNEFTISKEVIAQLPQTWHTAFVQVTIANARRTATSEGQPLNVIAGSGIMGLSRK